VISTKGIVTSLVDIPEEFIFETFLKLDTKLIGQEVVIKSVFNQERTPSMCVFFDAQKKRYYFKCFSSARGGTAFELVQLMNPDKTRGEIATLLLSTYKDYLKGNPVDTQREYKQFGKYKVDGHTMRNWSDVDKKFWSPGNISSKILERFNVAPLQSFSMSKMEEGVKKTINISRDKLYGYFTKQGDIFRIYQPGTTAKYLKVFPYTQGRDQLKYNVSTLIVFSGMKDGAAFTSLEIPDTEFIAGDSENTMIPEIEMKEYLGKYERVFICFDEDAAGRAATVKYVEKYPIIKPLYTNFGVKDVFDSVVKYKPEKVRSEFIKLLQ
jgi:hypothetical protein